MAPSKLAIQLDDGSFAVSATVLDGGDHVLTNAEDADCCCSDDGGQNAFCEEFEDICGVRVTISGLVPTANGYSDLLEEEGLRITSVEVVSYFGLNGPILLRPQAGPSPSSIWAGTKPAGVVFRFVYYWTDTSSNTCGEPFQVYTRTISLIGELIVSGRVYCVPNPDDPDAPGVLGIGDVVASIDGEFTIASDSPDPFFCDPPQSGYQLVGPTSLPFNACLGVATLGQSLSDCRPAVSPVDQSTANAIWQPYGASVTLNGFLRNCPPEDDVAYYYAESCDGSVRITVDPSTNIDNLPAATDGVQLFRVIDEVSEENPTAVTWVSDLCPPEVTEYALYIRCSGTQTITVDETGRPPAAQTAIYQGNPYRREGSVSTDDPVDVTWSEDPCPVEGEVWERCSNTQFPNVTIAQRIRVLNPPGGDVRGLRRVVGSRPCPEGGNQFIAYNVWYRRVTEDNAEHLAVNNFIRTDPEACGNLNDGPFAVGPCDDDNPILPGDPIIGSPAAAALSRPTYPIPDDFDPEQERRRMQQGGCCH